MSFVRRLIDVTFELGEGTAGVAAGSTVTLQDLRVSAHVENAGGRALGQADVRIWGMALSKMNQLSTLGVNVTALRRNTLTLSARVEGEPPAAFFKGRIIDAWADLNAQPDVAFAVTAQTGAFEAVQMATPISINGSADVASMLSGVAAQMKIPFENNGVTAKLNNAYYAGSLREQAENIVSSAGICWNSMENGILAIWPPGGSRGSTAVTISAATGMVGYPTFTANGIIVKTVFNPSIGLGSKIKVESSIQSMLSRKENPQNPEKAMGEWSVWQVNHQLESILPNGVWYSVVTANPLGMSPIVPGGR